MERFSKSVTYRYAGVKVTESKAATALPSACPQTDDMRDMVDDLQRFGAIKRKPAAFQLPNGDIVIHPDLSKRLRTEMAKRMERETERMFFGIYGAPRP